MGFVFEALQLLPQVTEQIPGKEHNEKKFKYECIGAKAYCRSCQRCQA